MDSPTATATATNHTLTGHDVYLEGWRAGWAPEPRLSIADWSDEHVIIDARPGQAPTRFRSDTTPYTRDILEALSPYSRWKRVVLIFGTQLGKTQTGLNWLAAIMVNFPGAVLVLRPTVPDARDFSKQRLDPMISATAVLSQLVTKPRSRDGGNSLLAKDFAGGNLFLTGSNSATGIKSKPIRWLFCDEIDEYPGDVKGQGEPVYLAEKRLTGPQFQRRKILLVSTPTIKGRSRIEDTFEASDQHRYFVPCPHCEHMDWIRWANIRWDEGKPETAELFCEACGVFIEELCKTQMLARGEWRCVKHAGDGETIGFHLSSLYSPIGWFPWVKAAQEWIEAKENPMKLKGFVNTVLAETFEERWDKKQVKAEEILARAERYPASVPTGVGILVAAVDVQDTWLEVAVKDYGAGEESWLIALQQFQGDPGEDTLWLELDRFLQQTFTHESGQEIPISCVVIDCGGSFPQMVYRFTKARESRRVFAIRGGNERGKPIVPRPTRNNRYRAVLFTLCVDTAKETVLSRLAISAKGKPGYMHFPEWIELDYCKQLLAEKPMWRWSKTKGSVREWIKVQDRNEAFDLEGYCLAALNILGPGLIQSLPEKADELAQKVESQPAPADERPPPPQHRRPGWVDGWRGV